MPVRSKDWGPWRLMKQSCELSTDPRSHVRYAYPVDLTRCTTSAEVLDRICQIAQKTWANDATLAGLVRAINEILYPQATLCSSGRHLTISVEDIKARVRDF